MIDTEIFEPFDRLVEIDILGEQCSVPENNTLLRCFQYLSMDTVSFGELCWNGDCANCQIWLENVNGKAVLSCRTKVQAGMKIVRMSEKIKFK